MGPWRILSPLLEGCPGTPELLGWLKLCWASDFHRAPQAYQRGQVWSSNTLLVIAKGV